MATLEDLHLDVMKNEASIYDFPDINHQLIERLLCGATSTGERGLSKTI